MSAALGVQLEGFAALYGLNLSEYCATHGIDYKSFLSLTGRMSCISFANILEDMAIEANEPLFGFKYASAMDLAAVGPICNAISYAKDFRTAWDVTCRFRQLGMNHAKLSLTVSGETAKIAWALSPFVDGMAQLSDFTMVFSLNLFKGFGEFQTDVVQINTRRKPPADKAFHDALFLGKISYGMEEDSVLFRASLLDAPNPKADKLIYAYMRLQCEALYKLYSVSRPVEDEVRQAILQLFDSDELNLASTAKRLAMSERTLQRQLNRRNISFTQLLEQTRRDYASHLLCDNSNSIEKVATLVGFSSASAFSNAATSWFGSPPSSYRLELQKMMNSDYAPEN